MSFYSSIANNYNAIFPFTPVQLEFVKRHVPIDTHSKLMEIGSAIGSLTNELMKAGYQTSGLELDQNMVNIARAQYPDIPFVAKNMLELDQLTEEESLDSLVCFGNTIVHLTDTKDLKHFIQSAYKALRAGGVFLVQFINYDNILDHSVAGLPTIDNDKITFERRYKVIRETSISFDTTLTTKSDNCKLENSQLLYPMRKQTFLSLANEAGFNVKAFGNFKSDAWHNKTMQSIFVCEKQ